MSDERINMTADEFFDTWSDWCPSLKAGDDKILDEVLVNILQAFAERGSVTSGRMLMRPGQIVFRSPDMPGGSN